jgi:hypothetical protein
VEGRLPEAGRMDGRKKKLKKGRFIYGLFNDAVSNSDCIASDDTVINGQRIGRDIEGSGYCII